MQTAHFPVPPSFVAERTAPVSKHRCTPHPFLAAGHWSKEAFGGFLQHTVTGAVYRNHLSELDAFERTYHDHALISLSLLFIGRRGESGAPPHDWNGNELPKAALIVFCNLATCWMGEERSWAV